MVMIRRTSRYGLVLALVYVFAPVIARAQDAPKAPGSEPRSGVIMVEVSGLRADKGQIGCAIFSRDKGFPDEMDKALKQVFVKPKGKKAVCRFEGYAPGTYAISVMHDLDMNGELNTSFVGKPKEPWGVSNNAPMQRFGPPRYDDCTFKYAGGDKNLKVKLPE